jgi:lipopolysaccharide/colanic/teichoic acid biosynthesis glycosyltransferase
MVGKGSGDMIRARMPRGYGRLMPNRHALPAVLGLGMPGRLIDPNLTKRMLDLVLAVPALIVAVPVMLAAMAWIRISDPGPVLFRQVRVGKGGRPFTMLKLRTMYIDNDDCAFREFNTRELLGEAQPRRDGMFKLDDDPRILPGGRFLRRYSIDELPQLINVLKGDMSLVGPRPSLPWEVELYSSEQRRRHDCLPGMTGLWQVSGRSRLTMQQMLEIDLAYVEQRSLGLDLWILLHTLPAVLLGDTH